MVGIYPGTENEKSLEDTDFASGAAGREEGAACDGAEKWCVA